MKRACIALGVLALSLPGAASAGQGGRDYHAGMPDVARTQKDFAGGADEFRFVVIGDRTGKHRPGVFEHAMDKVERLRPDFVINIGDLIEGNTEDRQQLDTEWADVNAAINRLSVPFFYVPGNHDLTNEVQRTDWRKRLGGDYYSFTYKNALFLVLNTEDPPQPKIARMKLFQEYGGEAMKAVFTALQGDPAEAEALFAKDPRLAELAAKIRGSENVAFSADQVKMVREALAKNPKARWIFVLMHRPAWKIDSPAFREIEAMLKGRPHTVLAGHYHKYAYEARDGRDYIQLGTTGGVPGGAADDPSVVDHLMWVSMSKDAPRITNLRLDGFFDKQGPAKAKAKE
ncbi:metallophosphoesterase family protein [Sphingomonas cavernae]|uniref:Metallophosphoesterase n=1 Tax=Sphingomonas cavernae TaxID=2320861 RepID=A0A418WPC7_9SPHN|nr:metallophosphoesterase [Sphingomonas cavernae]RJF93102.1 metallophosphoesterase [Sphingomonas cavernae]